VLLSQHPGVPTTSGLLLLIGFASSGYAQSATAVVPTVTVSTAHDDNIFSSSRPVADLVTVVRPSLATRLESSRFDVRSLASLDLQRTARHTLPISLNARRHADAAATGRVSPTLSLSGIASYDRTENASDLTRESGILLARQRATRTQVMPSFAYQWNPQTEIAGQYGWIYQQLAGAMSNRAEVGYLSVTNQITPRTSWTAKYLGRRFADDIATRRSHAALVGLSRRISPGTTAWIQGGPRAAASGGLAHELVAALAHVGARSRLMLDYWHGETSVLGVPGAVEVESGTSRLTVAVRPRVEIGANLGIFRTATPVNQARATVLHASASVLWNFDPFAVNVSYGVDHQRGRLDLLRQPDVRRRVLLVSFSVTPRWSRRNPGPPERGGPITPLRGAQP
jgi:hypothetical protein